MCHTPCHIPTALYRLTEVALYTAQPIQTHRVCSVSNKKEKLLPGAVISWRSCLMIKYFKFIKWCFEGGWRHVQLWRRYELFWPAFAWWSNSWCQCKNYQLVLKLSNNTQHAWTVIFYLVTWCRTSVWTHRRNYWSASNKEGQENLNLLWCP